MKEVSQSMVSETNKIEVVTVRFENVGPSKRCWTAVMTAPLTAEKMIRAIHKQHALGSRGIEFSEEREDCWGGSIFVGVFRKVGTWHVIEPVEVRSGVPV